MTHTWREDVEKLSAEIHKCYCRAYERRFGKPYWTGGDYSKLEEAVKDYDREMAKFMLAALEQVRADADRDLNMLRQSSLEKQTAIRDALQEELNHRKRLDAENKKLKDFLDWLFEDVFEGDPDGGSIQDKAEEMGILVTVKIPQEKIDADPDKYEKCIEYGTDELLFPYWSEEAQPAAPKNEKDL